MKQEDKELLLKDLCGRLPYGVKAKANDITVVTINGIVKRQSLTGHFYYDIITDNGNFYLNEIKPYLRSMSSMTEEEQEEWFAVSNDGGWGVSESLITECVDWLNEHHFDYRGLIDRGLAIEVTDDNNPYKN